METSRPSPTAVPYRCPLPLPRIEESLEKRPVPWFRRDGSTLNWSKFPVNYLFVVQMDRTHEGQGLSAFCG